MQDYVDILSTFPTKNKTVAMQEIDQKYCSINTIFCINLIEWCADWLLYKKPINFVPLMIDCWDIRFWWKGSHDRVIFICWCLYTCCFSKDACKKGLQKKCKQCCWLEFVCKILEYRESMVIPNQRIQFKSKWSRCRLQI